MPGILKKIATLGFIGYAPFAPGTFASLAAFLVYVILKPSAGLNLFILLLVVPLGIVSSHYAEIMLNEKDSKHIVIDEVCGYFVSVLFIPFNVGYALAAFFLFRIFDILKPFPVNLAESLLTGGKGIMADDLVAALYTNLILHVWLAFA